MKSTTTLLTSLLAIVASASPHHSHHTTTSFTSTTVTSTTTSVSTVSFSSHSSHFSHHSNSSHHSHPHPHSSHPHSAHHSHSSNSTHSAHFGSPTGSSSGSSSGPVSAGSASTGSCSVQFGVQQTFYGYPDNSPPGAGIAYTQCGRSQAGGTGTYDDPLTMATASGELKVCEVVYAPYLKKYLRYEDECAQCNTDWKNGGKWHIDTWTGSSTENGGQKQIDCEDSLTPDAAQSIIRNPSRDLPVDSKHIHLKRLIVFFLC